MRPALLLVDLQNDFLRAEGLEPPAGEVVARAAALLRAFRARGAPVFHACTTVGEGGRAMPHWERAGLRACVEGTEGHRVPLPVAPVPGERVFHKTFFSAFGVPALEESARAAGIDTIVVAGVHLHGCVRATVLDAYERGFAVVIAGDAVASHDPLHAAATRRWLAARAARFLPVDAILRTLSGGGSGAVPETPRGGGARRLARLAPHAGRRARGAPRPVRARDRGGRPSARRADGHGDRQAGALRRPGGRAGRGAPARGGAARRGRGASLGPGRPAHAKAAARGRRARDPVEQPGRDPAREDRSRARVREHGGLEARARGGVGRGPRRGAVQGNRRAARDPRDRHGGRGGRPLPPRGPPRPRHLAHRLRGRGRRRPGDRGPAARPAPGGARRQQRGDRLVGRGPRPCGRADRGGGVRAGRAAVHRRTGVWSWKRRARTISSPVSRARQGRSRSATPRIPRPTWARSCRSMRPCAWRRRSSGRAPPRAR